MQLDAGIRPWEVSEYTLDEISALKREVEDRDGGD